MIGNDIVDLGAARQESNWQRSGYLDKLFTRSEQEQIRTAAEPEQQLWLLWSCKEAAYKAWVTEFGQRRFAPKRLRTVKWTGVTNSAFRAVIATEERRYQVEAFATPDYVQARTSTPSVELQYQQTYHYPARSAADIRTTVRQSVRQHCARLFRWSAADIQLAKNELGRPLVYYQGELRDVYLSWAHHGSRAALLIGTPPR